MSMSEQSVPEPRANPHLLGHEAAEQAFMADFAQGRTHHAYLISGPKGIGKATLAFRLARNILVSGAQAAAPAEAPSLSLFGEPEPSPVQDLPGVIGEDHPVFRRVAAGSHADLLTLSPAYDAKKHVEKNLITVEEARQVPEFMSLTPAEGLWRVVVVDAVDQLNNQAANALLKILEEPPARAILLLVCHQPRAILPTIRSRCRALKLSPPQPAVFRDILARVAPAVGYEDYGALYALSHGSPGHAITLHQHEGLKWYGLWLEAMLPNAAASARQKLIDSAGQLKAPAAWQSVIDAWHVAMQRVTMFPHLALEAPITREEPALLGAIAQPLSIEAREAWFAAGRELIAQTDMFHLDKRQSLRMLMRPEPLHVLAA